MSEIEKNLSKTGRWSFEEGLAENFNEHISRSVPMYKEGHDLIIKLSDFFINNESVCYELGCADGTLTKKIATHNSDKKARFIGLDSAAEMIDFANKENDGSSNFEFINRDVMSFEYEKSDMIISYYLMQFIHPKMRQDLFNIIYDSLNWGGAFIIFEKVRASDARFQDIMTTLYFEYKKERGYSNDEIMKKMLSLKGVLEPFSSQANIDLMKRAGFVDIVPVMKYLCFEGFLAIK